MTKKELSQLYFLNNEIKQQRQRLAELEAAATSCTSTITGMPHGSAIGDKVSKYAADIADLKGLIECNIQKCWYELNRLNKYISSIPDSQVRQIFYLRYISHMSWQRIANSMGIAGDGSTERKKHDRYLKLSRDSRKKMLRC